MNEIRILHFVNVLDHGGTESFIFNNLDKIDRRIINFDFLLTRNRNEAYDEKLVEYGCMKIIIEPEKGSRIKEYFSLYKKLLNYFKECKYQVVHFESNPPGIMATASILAARNARIPVRILHSHGAGGEKTSFGVVRPLITHICRFINTRCCTLYMAPTSFAAEYGFGKRLAKSNKCFLVRNSIDIEKYVFNSTKRNEYRKKLNVENKYVVGTIGRISEVKNHTLMLRIFAELLKTEPSAELLLIGGEVQVESGLRNKLIIQAQELHILDHVIFYGDCNDVPGILNCMDVFLFTSKTEAFGIAAMEAQINGLSVIAASNGIPKEVDITGNMGWLRLEDDVMIWAEKLAKTIKNGRNYIDISSYKMNMINAQNTAIQLTDIYLKQLR